MAQIIDPMATLQSYQTANQLNAMRAQQMELNQLQEARASQMQPLNMEAQNMNILAKRMAMDEDRRRRNALQQFGATGNINMLAQADPAAFAKFKAQEMLMRNKLNAPPKPIWDSARGVFVMPPSPGGMQGGVPGMRSGMGGGVIRPQGLPDKPIAPTEGQKSVDREFGKEYASFKASGGYADTVKQLNQLTEAAVALQNDDTLTGPFRGALPDSVRSYTNPKAVSVKNAVEEVVQRNLRLVLGAQFTEKEGERLIARAFNERLEPKENARRVNRLITQIRDAAKAKQSAADYFEKNGTLTGWKGELPTWANFNPGGDDGGASGEWTVQEVK